MAVHVINSSAGADAPVIPAKNAETTTIRPVWERAILNVTDSRGRTFRVIDVIHNPTGTLYNDDTLYVVAAKCFILALTSPIFYTIKAVWHASRIVVDTVVIASSFFYQIATRDNTGPSFKEISERTFQDLTSKFQHNLWRVVRTPFVIIGMEAGALLGLIAPYEGRRVVGFMERLYNEDKSLQESNCLFDDCLSRKITSWSALSEAFSTREVCYLARCFQPLGSVSNSAKFQVVERMPIMFRE